MTTVLPTPEHLGATATGSAKTGIDLGPAVALSCRECGHRIELGPYYACTECFGPLEVAYEFALSGEALRQQIEAGPDNIWRWAPLLPVPAGVAQNTHAVGRGAFVASRWESGRARYAVFTRDVDAAPDGT